MAKPGAPAVPKRRAQSPRDAPVGYFERLSSLASGTATPATRPGPGCAFQPAWNAGQPGSASRMAGSRSSWATERTIMWAISARLATPAREGGARAGRGRARARADTRAPEPGSAPVAGGGRPPRGRPPPRLGFGPDD